MRSMEREFFLGFIKIHILHHASKEPVYGLWLIEELGRHGYRLSPGTLYPMLRSMEEQGLLKSRREIVGGKVRKYYRATKKGERALADSLEKIRELVKEVLEGGG
ncbi:MAG: PadR family transcriptional regulator [Actinomycetota bacterium]|nr:PadR family transcriptional regulator [Actinomycetota bacterium]MDI7252973.1 PadR family transcriptional regulator [Actinomycetota bacterium]